MLLSGIVKIIVKIVIVASCIGNFLSDYCFVILKINISSRFSSNSEADASELLENIREIFLRYLY